MPSMKVGQFLRTTGALHKLVELICQVKLVAISADFRISCAAVLHEPAMTEHGVPASICMLAMLLATHLETLLALP